MQPIPTPNLNFSNRSEELRQGAEVFFRIPYAQAPALKKFQQGVIISTNSYNRLNDRPCICPISTEPTPIDIKYGIPIERRNGRVDYLRPDATSFLSKDYCELTIIHEGSRVKYLETGHIARAIERFVELLTPDPKKIQQYLTGYMGYGQVGWLHQIPRITEDHSDSAPVLCLTPPHISRETGIMQIARGYSNHKRYRQRVDVAVADRNWFSLGFFSTRDVHAIDWHSPDRVQFARPFTLADGKFRDLRAISKKSRGLLDPTTQQEINNRYTDLPGDLPGFIVNRCRGKIGATQPRL